MIVFDLTNVDVCMVFIDVLDRELTIELLCVDIVVVLLEFDKGHGFGGQVKLVWLLVRLPYVGVTSCQTNRAMAIPKVKATNILTA